MYTYTYVYIYMYTYMYTYTYTCVVNSIFIDMHDTSMSISSLYVFFVEELPQMCLHMSVILIRLEAADIWEA